MAITTGRSPAVTPNSRSRRFDARRRCRGRATGAGCRLRARNSRIRQRLGREPRADRPGSATPRRSAAPTGGRGRRPGSCRSGRGSVAITWRSAVAGTAMTSPASATRADTKTRWPVSRFSSPRNRPGPWLAISRSSPSARDDDLHRARQRSRRSRRRRRPRGRGTRPARSRPSCPERLEERDLGVVERREGDRIVSHGRVVNHGRHRTAGLHPTEAEVESCVKLRPAVSDYSAMPGTVDPDRAVRGPGPVLPPVVTSPRTVPSSGRRAAARPVPASGRVRQERRRQYWSRQPWSAALRASLFRAESGAAADLKDERLEPPVVAPPPRAPSSVRRSSRFRGRALVYGTPAFRAATVLAWRVAHAGRLRGIIGGLVRKPPLGRGLFAALRLPVPEVVITPAEADAWFAPRLPRHPTDLRRSPGAGRARPGRRRYGVPGRPAPAVSARTSVPLASAA